MSRLNPLLRAALPSIPGVNLLPGIRKVPLEEYDGLAWTGLGPVTLERDHIERYAAVCGFAVRDTVPLTYPHLLGFPAQLSIMGGPDFPAPAIGSVHVQNAVTAHRALLVGEQVRVSVTASAARPHAKGTAFDFTTTLRDADDAIAWESTSTYLRRGRGDDDAPAAPSYPDAPTHGLTWRLPADLGRRYAAVSGDHNPIHLHPLTAKALGFPRQIAHGMWTLARCVAALENRLPDAVRVEASFKKPVLLPGTVAYGVARLEDGWAFSLARPGDGAPHLAGRTTTI
jgi:acyl dehydratase